MPAATTPDTGHGASITFATTSGTWLCRTIGGADVSRPVVDITHLATATNRRKMPGDLNDWGAVTIQVLFQGTQGLPVPGTTETITWTSPIPSGGSAGGNLAGTGHINRVKYPDLSTNQEMIAEIEFTWDGGTGPTWTAAT